MVFEKMRELIAEQFSVDADEVTMESSFEEDFSADSIGYYHSYMYSVVSFCV